MSENGADTFVSPEPAQGQRGQFASRLGFVMAAAGSAVGLGNIWGFPTQAASNGGAAFLLVYLVLAFCLAYPVLIAELVIGRHAHANTVRTLAHVGQSALSKRGGRAIGLYGMLISSLILSFYSIVGGWMIAHLVAALAKLVGLQAIARWSVEFNLTRNLIYTGLFMALTVSIVSGGVEAGIERWCRRLMPFLFLILCVLIGYVVSLDGALAGLRVYLLPDLGRALAPDLIVKALGQAFFSLSLGVGTMMIYGSYLPDDANIPRLGRTVTLVDVAVAVLAGLLVLPAMYVAMHNGVEIFTETGALISEDTLIFVVLPELFDTLGIGGIFVASAFFLLMTVAALTSSISMLEVPVAFVTETFVVTRQYIAVIIGALVASVSVLIMLNFSVLFGAVVALTTRYSQPILGLLICVYTGWVWSRGGLLEELRKGDPRLEQSLFWRVWPFYLRYICPVVILTIFLRDMVS